MTTTTERIRQHVLDSLGFPKPVPDLAQLRKTQWNHEFEQLMRNRLIMGAFRYGVIHVTPTPWEPCVRSIVERINEFASTGNREHLVDVANLAMVLFEFDNHPNGHFHAADDGIHVT